MDAKEQADEVGRGLFGLYERYVKRVEIAYHFDNFMSPFMTEADFMAAPLVLVMGQYSVGKTTFICNLLGRTFPGARIGQEPTTDKFTAVMYGHTERQIPGNAAAVQKDKPFHGLESFGMPFLSRFEISELDAPILQHITLIDSPGILSGEKQRIQRGYDFPSVVNYWATRADRILLLFDAHKLDISDEMKESILAVRGNFDKIYCVLNKADQVNQEELMRIYGALLWSLGKVIQAPEAMRVFVSSFWDKEYENKGAAQMFDSEKKNLLADLQALPRNSAIRKVNEFVKRTQRCKIHALICHTLRSHFGFFSKEKKQEQLLQDLPAIFQQVATRYNIPLADFPNPQKFAATIKNWEVWKFPRLKPRHIGAIDEVLDIKIPRLLEKVGFSSTPLTGSKTNPFSSDTNADEDSISVTDTPWIITEQQKETFDEKFSKLEIIDSKTSAEQVKPLMLQTQLSNQILEKIWNLSDVDKDGLMNSEEFALCMFLLAQAQEGKPLPDELPENYIPPSFRGRTNVSNFDDKSDVGGTISHDNTNVKMDPNAKIDPIVKADPIVKTDPIVNTNPVVKTDIVNTDHNTNTEARTNLENTNNNAAPSGQPSLIQHESEVQDSRQNVPQM